MHAANDIVRIDKAKCIRFTLWVETDTREVACSPTGVDSKMGVVPTYRQMPKLSS